MIYKNRIYYIEYIILNIFRNNKRYAYIYLKIISLSKYIE